MNQRMATTETAETTADADSSSTRLPRVLYKCDNNGRRDAAPAEVSLFSPVRGYLAPTQHGSELGFRCLSIGAVPGDGITTARQEVEERIQRMDQRVQIVALEGRPVEDGLPDLFKIVSRRNIVQAARKAGAKGIPRPLRPWVTAAVIAAAIAITAILSLLTPLGGANGRGLASLVHPLSVVSVFLFAALGVGAQLLVNMATRDKDREPPEQKITEWMASQQHGPAYEGFIESLTAKFARFNGLRCLIVDDFKLLDRPTRDVLIRYMRDYATDRPPELWVVFDSSHDPGRGQFSSSLQKVLMEARLAEGHKIPDGVKRVHHYELASLSAEQRIELARRVGKPERAGYRTVKAIVADKDETLPAYFEQLIPPTGPRQDPARYAAFQLLYLLGLDSVAGGSVTWPERALLKKLAEQRQRSLVLRQILTGSGPSRSGPSKTNLATRLERMRHDFGRVIQVDAHGSDVSMVISAEAGDLLGQLSGRFELAETDLGHLFWALYRHDNRDATADDPFWVNKASNHALRAASPHDYADRFGSDVGMLADRLFSAILDAVGDSLRLSQLTLVPQLLQRAAYLLEEDDRKNRLALLRQARDAYAVLADDSILRILLDLRSAGQPRQAGAPVPVTNTSALELFLHATAGAPHLNASAFAPGHSLAALKEDAELRGSWLALSFEPFATRLHPQLRLAVAQARATVPPVADAVISGIADTGVSEVANAVQPAQAKRSGGAEIVEVANLVNVSIGLWCWALTGSMPGVIVEDESSQEPRPDISEQLAAAYIVADDLRQFHKRNNSRDSGRSTVDLAREGLTEELLTVTAATALLVKRTWRDLSHVTAAKVDDVLKASMSALGIEVPEQEWEAGSRQETLTSLSERMSLLQVTWKALGYEQLATMLNIRRIQLMALLTPPIMTPERARAAEHSSVEDRDRADLLGLLTNLAVAQQALPSTEAAAEALVYGVTASLSGEMDEEFTVQLCMHAISYAHSYQTSFRQIVQDLHGSSQVDPSGTRLDQLLDSMDEEQLDSVALQILNVADKVSGDGPRLEAALRRRAETVSDEKIRVLLEEEFYVHELVRKQNANEPVDLGEVLSVWAGHQDSDSYPYVLYRLIEVNDAPLPPQLREAISPVLVNFRSYLGRVGIGLLGQKLAERFTRQARGGSASTHEFDEADLVDVLRTAEDELSGGLSVDTNISILEFLHKHDALRVHEYESQLAYWREEKLTLIEERELPHLLSAGRYALLMLAYLGTLMEYGLKITEEADAKPLSLPEKNGSKANYVQLRRAAAHPFLTVRGELRLNAQFWIGALKLFRSELSKDSQYDDLRYEFDNAAKRSMKELFKFLIDLSEIPDSIREILERHEKLVTSRLAAPIPQDPALLT